MTKLKSGHINQKIADWYEGLDEHKQLQLQQWAEEGGGEFVLRFREMFGEEVGLFEAWHDEIRRALKRKTRQSVLVKVVKECPGLPEFIGKSLIRAVHSSLQNFRLALFLREMDSEEFARVVELIVLDNYVERRYSTWDKCHSYLKLDDELMTRGCYRIVAAIMEYHYHLFETLEELEEFMTEELEWEADKVEVFIGLIVRYREAIDRTMLFKKLKRIERQLGESEQ